MSPPVFVSRKWATSFEEINGFLRREGLVGTAPWLQANIEGPTVSAQDDGCIIGAARLYRYWLHPERWRLAIHVERDRRRQGTGTALIDALMDRLPDDKRHFQAATSASNVAGVAFLRARGFAPLMITHLGKLDPAEVSASLRDRSRKSRDELACAGVRMVTLAERPELFGQTAILHERIYREQHAWNLPVSLTHEQARQLFMDSEEMDLTMQLLAMRDDGSLCGVASLRTTSDTNLLDLGWVGTVDEARERSTQLVRALLGTCVDIARQREASIGIEVDRASPVAVAVFDELLVDWEDDWLTFARAR